MAETTTVSVSHKYSVQVWFWDFNPETQAESVHGNDTKYPTKGENRAEAEAHLAQNYSNDQHGSWDHYIIFEETTTVATEQTDLGEVSTTTIVDAPYVQVERTVESKQAKREWAAEDHKRRVESGELALLDAYWDEQKENIARREAGEPELYTAAVKFYEFMGYFVPEAWVAEQKEPKPSLGKRLFSFTR